MEYKVFMFSDGILKGQAQFDFKKFNQICASKLINISDISIERFNLDKPFLEDDKNLIIFCENKYLDELIIKNIKELGNNKKLINEQALIFKKNDFNIAFLPLEIDLEILNKIFDNEENFTYGQYRVFGLSKESVLKSLNNLKEKFEDFDYNIIYDNLICDIFVKYKRKDDSLIDDCKLELLSVFEKYVFSEDNSSLSNIVSSLLLQKNKTISICENITNGKILYNLLNANKDFDKVLKLINIKDVECENDEQLVDFSMKFLKEAGSDIAVVTLGGYNDSTLEFKFALANKNEVHIYNSTFKADKNVCKEMAKNSVLFHLMKKLRQNDFAF